MKLKLDFIKMWLKQKRCAWIRLHVFDKKRKWLQNYPKWLMATWLPAPQHWLWNGIVNADWLIDIICHKILNADWLLDTIFHKILSADWLIDILRHEILTADWLVDITWYEILIFFRFIDYLFFFLADFFILGKNGDLVPISIIFPLGSGDIITS